MDTDGSKTIEYVALCTVVSSYAIDPVDMYWSLLYPDISAAKFVYLLQNGGACC